MNVLAGLFIYWRTDTTEDVLLWSFVWGFIHIGYGYLYGAHDNPIVRTDDRTSYHTAIRSFYIAKYLTGFLTSFIIAKILYWIL
jgi:hypothetical protein